jgi:ABC-type sugar transport system substrate-binding protein
MSTLIAICDYDAGYDLGKWVGGNVRNVDGSPLRVLDVGLPWLRPCLLRSEGFVDGVLSIQADAIVVASINGEATPSVAKKISEKTLREKGDVDVIFTARTRAISRPGSTRRRSPSPGSVYLVNPKKNG